MAISTAILAAEYAVCQPVALLRTTTPSLGVLRVSKDGEPMRRAIAVDEATSAPNPLRDLNRCVNSAGDGGIVAGEFCSRRRGIVVRADGNTSSMVD